MSNDYFNDTSPLARHTTAKAEVINTKMAAIEAGFDLLPDKLVLNEGRTAFALDTGAANAYVVAMPQTWASYTNGAMINLQIGAGNSNTGASTINVDSLGVRNIKRMDGTDVVSGDLVAGRVYTLVYDSANTQFNLLSYVSTDQTSINTVATNIANVSTVAGISGNVTTVAGISANVTTVAGISANVTTVAGINSDVTTVAGISSDVSTVAADGTDIGTVATNIANVNTVAGISADVTTVAADGTDIGTVAGISADVTTVAGISADVDALGAVAADIGTLADIEDGTVATNAIQTAASNVTNIGTVAGISADVTAVAGVSANVTTVAGISGNVTTVAGISADVTTTAGISGNITTVAGVSADVTTVAGISSDVSTVASNVADVSNFAARYRIAASAPATSLDEGDLYYNTTDNQLYVYDGASWNAAAFDTSGALVATNNLSDLTNAGTARTNLGLAIGTDVQAHSAVLDATTASFTTADETKLDGIEAGADVTDTANVTAAGALMDSEVSANIKTLTLPASTTISTFGASLIDDASASAARTTLEIDYATGAEIQAGTANKILTADNIETACEPETISGASDWTPDWSTFITATYAATANRTINNPTNVEPGTTRYAKILSSTSTARTISWGSYYKGSLPDGGVTNTAYVLVSMYAQSTTEIIVGHVVEGTLS